MFLFAKFWQSQNLGNLAFALQKLRMFYLVKCKQKISIPENNYDLCAALAFCKQNARAPSAKQTLLKLIGRNLKISVF